jgi:hypothetical protein
MAPARLSVAQDSLCPMSIRSGSDAVALLGLIVGANFALTDVGDRGSGQAAAAPVSAHVSTGFVSR